MVPATTERLLHHLRRLLVTAGAPEASDRQLLERFTVARDEAAFAALVGRHGPMVLGVCRRVLGDCPTTEDAFQATFLTLARRAASVRRRDTVGGWLYGVAHRLALKARADEARRQRHERQAAAARPIAISPDHACRELLAVLDKELLRLPECYRLPLLLCYLEGHTQDEAARELGWSLSTLRRRLERGRELLRGRMIRRGATLSAGLFAAALTTGATTAAVPAGLVRTTVQSAAATAASPAVEALARAVGGVTWLTKGKIALALLLAVGLAVGAWAGRDSGSTPAQPAAEAARPAGERDASLPPGALFRLGTGAFRHRLLRLTAATFSPDGKLIATSGEDGRACVWDAATGRLVHEFACGVNHFAPGLAFAPDGKRLAVANGRGGFLVLNAETGREESKVQCPAKGKFHELAAGFAPDGRPLMLFEGDEEGEPFAVHDGRSAERLATFAAPRGSRVLQVAADGKSVAVATGRSVSLLALDTGRSIRSFDAEAPVSTAALSRDGRTLTVLEESGAVGVWDAADGKELRRITPARADKFSGRVALSPDGRRLAVAGLTPDVAELFDTASGRRVRAVPSEGAWAACVSFSPDGQTLAIGEWARLRLWDVATGKEQLTGGPGHVRGAAFGSYAPDGRSIVSAGWDGRVCLWDGRTGAAIRSWSPHVSFSAATVSPDGRRVLACGNDEVRVFEADTGAEVLRFRGETTGVCAADFSPDGKLLAVTEGKGEVVLRRADDGHLVRRLAGEAAKHDNLSLAFSPDGRLLAGIHRQRLRFWDVATGAELPGVAGDQPYGRLAFSNDGRTLTAFSRDTLTTWDVAARKKVADLPLLPPDSPLDLHAFALSPDGRVAATADSSGEVRVWELASHRERFRFASAGGAVFSLAFAPDGRTLLAGNADGTLLAWDTAALPRPQRLPGRLADEELPRLWKALAEDAAPAYEAIRTLAARPAQAVALLGEQLRPVVVPSPALLKRLAGELDSDDFAVREKATEELAKLGEPAAPALREAAASGSPEASRRAARLLEAATADSGEALRRSRAVEVLERAGTPEARRLLESLVRGMPEARLTREAREALRRLAGLKK